MYLYALMLCSIFTISSLMGSLKPVALTAPPKKTFHKKTLSQPDLALLAKTLGTGSTDLFVANTTKNDEERRKQEADTIVLTPKTSPKNNFMKKEAHNTKSLRAWCCGLSNKE